MAATCSEEAREALDLISPRSEPGVSPLHVLEASWPLQSCPIEAVLSRQRDLTLLEKYTLRSFNEIPGVSAAQIADRLGLKEPELIDETLQALQNAEAIDASVDNISSDEISELKAELRLIEEKLAANTFHGIVRRNMQRKVDNLRQQIKKSDSNSGLSWKERISKAFERLMRFTAKLTPRGREHLRDGTITEPAKKEVYDLARCLASGNVMTSKGHGFTRSNISDQSRFWIPVDNQYKLCANPTESEVKLALRRAGQLEGE